MANFDVTGKLTNSGGGSLVPIGALMPYAGATAPTNWLICNGQAVSRTTYADLFAVIGTTYGTGNGSSTFNVPNLQGRVPVGAGTYTEENTTKSYNRGNTGGSKDAIVVSHTHKIAVYRSNEVGYIPANANPSSVTVRTDVKGIENTGGTWTDRSYTEFSPNTTMSTTGSSGTDKNMQPYIALNYIIRAK